MGGRETQAFTERSGADTFPPASEWSERSPKNISFLYSQRWRKRAFKSLASDRSAQHRYLRFRFPTCEHAARRKLLFRRRILIRNEHVLITFSVVPVVLRSDHSLRIDEYVRIPFGLHPHLGVVGARGHVDRQVAGA